MKKIVLITSSTRVNGNSNAMANSFEKEAVKNGIEIIKIDSTKLNIGPCHGCETCFKTGKPCSYNDDFNKIANDIMSSDGIVISSPIYWYNFSAKIKSIIDKFYSFYIGDHLFTGKKCALIGCCESNNSETFTAMNYSFDETFKLLDADVVGKVLITGVYKEGDIKNTDGEIKAAKLVNKFI